MIVFTIIGYLVALCTAFELGRFLAMGMDARRAFLKLDNSVREVQALYMALGAYADGVEVTQKK
jgi:hypothetical protein